MRTLGSLMVALSVLASFAGVGCSTDGFTPTCTAPDAADCFEPAEGGTKIDVTAPDATSQPEAEASVTPDTATDLGPEVEPDAEPDAEPDDATSSDSQADGNTAD